MSVQTFSQDELISMANVNRRITQANAYFPVSVANGGTGATTPSGARDSLGVEGRTALYENVSGTNSTITLSNDLSLYRYVDIVFKSSSSFVYGTQRLYMIDLDMSVDRGMWLYFVKRASTTHVEITWNTSYISLHNKTITWGNCGTASIDMESGAKSYSETNGIKITHVYGYK